MAKTTYKQWKPTKRHRFKKDVRNGEKFEVISKRYKISKATIYRAMKFFGIKSPNSKNWLEKEQEEFILELFADNDYHYIIDAYEQKFGKRISRRTICRVAKDYNATKSNKYMANLYSNIGKMGAAKKNEVETTPEYREKMRLMVTEQIEKERWRISHGLEQKTKRNLSINPQLAKKRYWIKGNIIKRNNYFSADARTLCYDAETKRSKELEERYKHLFSFVPADGFDESNSKFVRQKKNGNRTA